MIRHFEAGILFLPSLCKNSKDEEISFTFGLPKNKEINSDDQFDISFPLPFKLPLEPYHPDKDKPWVWDIPYPKPDLFGKTWPYDD